MALKPEDRYATPRALADDVDCWLADEPTQAYTEPLWTRASRPIRRHKRLTVAATAAAATLVFLLVIGLTTYNRHILQEKRTIARQLHVTRTALRSLLQVSGESLAWVANAERLRADIASRALEGYQESERTSNASRMYSLK